MITLSLLTDEEAQEYQYNYDKWKETQPPFIAVEMSNEEIVKYLQKGEIRISAYWADNDITILDDEHRITDGVFYRKAANPYKQYEETIPWN